MAAEQTPPVTLEDVARRLLKIDGVSYSTLEKDGLCVHITEEVRDEVMKVVQELGYAGNIQFEKTAPAILVGTQGKE